LGNPENLAWVPRPPQRGVDSRHDDITNFLVGRERDLGQLPIDRLGEKGAGVRDVRPGFAPGHGSAAAVAVGAGSALGRVKFL